MLLVPAERNGPEQISRLRENQTPEGKTLDYKRDLNLDGKEDKKELARDVASFANAGGGFLVYGVNEEAGVPSDVVGVPCPDFDALKLKLDSVLADHIQPKVPGLSYGKIEGVGPNPVIVIHVPRSWVGPHMAALPKQSHFYSRGTAGRVTLDVHEIRNAFIAGTEIGERVRRFRDERLGRIVANEGAMPIWKRGPMVVTHLVPLVDNAEVFSAIAGKAERLPPMVACPNWNDRFSLDGYVTFPTIKPEQNEVYCYTVAFRSGAFERCEPMGVRSDFTPPQGYGSSLEREILDAAQLFVRLSRAHGNHAPLTFMCALLDARGIRIASGDYDRRPYQRANAIDRSVVNLPEVIFEGETITAEDLRSMFDALWQASGWPQSPNFDRDGKWIRPSS